MSASQSVSLVRAADWLINRIGEAMPLIGDRQRAVGDDPEGGPTARPAGDGEGIIKYVQIGLNCQCCRAAVCASHELVTVTKNDAPLSPGYTGVKV